MPLDHYVTLGRSGLRVSPLCLGAMTFGEDWNFGCDPATSKKIIDAYLDRGGNFIDTANIYTKGHSEHIIGEHLTHDRSKRDRVVLATKFLGNLFRGDPNGGGAHRKSLTSACEESLRRLRTDYIDLYWMHFHDPHTPIDETMRALDDLVRMGKVRYVGFSDTPAWKCVQGQYEAIFRSWTPAVALQIEYSLLERTVEFDLTPMAQQMGMGVTPWSPLKGGLLTGKFSGKGGATSGRAAERAQQLTDQQRRVIDTLAEVAKEVGRSSAQVALNWVQNRPGVSSTTIGARSLEQLEDNLGATDFELTDAQAARLEEASRVDPPFPHAFLKNTVNTVQGGTTVNGVPSEPWALSPENDKERW